MVLEDRIKAFVKLGTTLKNFTHTFYDDENSEFQKILSEVQIANKWFTKENQLLALNAIAEMLDEKTFAQWIEQYSNFNPPCSDEIGKILNLRRIGVIMAGNIPAVGFHDMLCVLITGNVLKAKCSSDDRILLKWISELLIEIEPHFSDKIFFVEKLSGIDAVIATGSDNSARYFDYYFSKYPHIIRKNRNAVAVLTGDESDEDLKKLGTDIFTYFGLGCRNVSKLFVPLGYDFNKFFTVIEFFSSVMQHNKYMNNHDYHRAVYLMNQVKFLTNNFLIIREDKNISTPVSVLNYEFYNTISELKKELETQKEKIQCIVSGVEEIENAIPFGNAQHPQIWDYADGVDTLEFLIKL